MNILVFVVPAVLLFWALGAYNRLVRLRNTIATVLQDFGSRARERTLAIDPLLQAAQECLPERADLVSATREADRELSLALDSARIKPIRSRQLAQLGRSDHNLGLSLGALCQALREHVGYEETQADPEAQHPVIGLLGRLDGVLTQTDFARLTYNQAASDYNEAIRLFPTTLAARLFGFEAAALLPAPPRSLG